ncbi:MAG TPA: hypothetical protein VFX61_16765 [Micromonosporaceae bacterium]|nr:hypothetical protein [Micromonosporaceae bacterium]
MINCTVKWGLTDAHTSAILSGMAWTVQRLDAERSRRRIQLLAAIAGAKSRREREHPQRIHRDRLRELIATRRRLAN